MPQRADDQAQVCQDSGMQVALVDHKSSFLVVEVPHRNNTLNQLLSSLVQSWFSLAIISQQSSPFSRSFTILIFIVLLSSFNCFSLSPHIRHVFYQHPFLFSYFHFFIFSSICLSLCFNSLYLCFQFPFLGKFPISVISASIYFH